MGKLENAKPFRTDLWERVLTRVPVFAGLVRA